MGKRILITGGMGFIGITLAKELVRVEYKIVIFDLLNNNKGDQFYIDDKNIDFIQGDMNETKKLKQLFENFSFSGIVHLAAVSRVIIAQKNPQECIRTNINGTKSLLKALEESFTQEKKPWLIFGSSREVYGEPKALPVSENFEKKFVNIYGDSKIQGENFFQEFSKNNRNNCAILRFSNVYGNEYDLLDRVIPKFIDKIYNEEALVIEGGDQIIDFTHIDDTIDTIIKTINYIDTKEYILDDFHVLPGIGWSLFELIEYIEEILQKKSIKKVNPKRNYDVEKFIGNPTKIRKILKSRDFLSLKEGLDLSIPLYLKVKEKK